MSCGKKHKLKYLRFRSLDVGRKGHHYIKVGVLKRKGKKGGHTIRIGGLRRYETKR